MRRLWFATIALLMLANAGCDATRQCFRAVECVEACGGPVVHNAGCGSCPDGLIDDIECRADGGGDGG